MLKKFIAVVCTLGIVATFLVGFTYSRMVEHWNLTNSDYKLEEVRIDWEMGDVELSGHNGDGWYSTMFEDFDSLYRW